MINDLVFINNNEAVTNSLNVAESFDKRHDHVLRDIENLMENLTPQNWGVKLKVYFYESTYEKRGKEYKMYYMNRDGFTLLAMGFTGKEALQFKLKYIDQFNLMEEQLKSQVALHSYMIEDPIKRAEKWIEEQKEKQLLVQKVEEQRPLVTFAEKCIKTNDSILIRELAKLISEQGVVNIGEKKLYTKLREWGLILQNKTEPSQRAMDMNLFEVIQRPVKTPYGDRLTSTCKVLPKGQVYIVEKLHKEIEDTKLLN